jgi:hypothetical protein
LKLVEPIDWDHVPLKQLYAPEVRKAYNPKLLTIPVHAACNKAFQKDEDYFVHALMPFARGSYAGNAIYQKTLHTFRQGRNPGLVRKVLREFEPRPSGLVLPCNKVVKRFNGARISRVAWKIVRGLYFDHHNEVLRAKAARWVSLTPPNQVPPEHFRVFVNLPENPSRGHGEYPGVFDYKFQKYPEGHYWALLFWDRIIMTVLFHDSSCSCDKANWILRSSVLQTLEWVLRKPVSKNEAVSFLRRSVQECGTLLSAHLLPAAIPVRIANARLLAGRCSQRRQRRW